MNNPIASKQTKRATIIIGMLVMSFFPIASFANVSVGSEVTQSLISSPYTSQCVSNYDISIYEGQSFISTYTHTPSTLASSREYFPDTNVKIYNPNAVFGDQISQNTLGGKLPGFDYKSNGRPGTNHFSFAGVQTVYVYKQGGTTYAVKPSPNTARGSLAAQIVHDFFRKQISSRGGSPYAMTFLPYGSTVAQSFTATPSAWYSMSETNKCQSFYIAKCGDGVTDDINKTGDASTDGRNGILVNGSVVNWRNTGFVAEVCDDGPLNGTSGYCNVNCTGAGGPIGPLCGNSIVDEGEECDAGPLNGTDLCELECVLPVMDVAVDEAIDE